MKKTVYLWLGNHVLELVVSQDTKPRLNPAIVSRGLLVGEGLSDLWKCPGHDLRRSAGVYSRGIIKNGAFPSLGKCPAVSVFRWALGLPRSQTH
jgi:hypothetical protein